MTVVRDGAFYGWPYSYYGQHVDTRVSPQRPDLVAIAVAPDYALGAHTASLGLAHSSHNALPARYQQGMFIGQHGSWNRRPRSGYKVIFVPFVDGQPNGLPLDVLAGFVDDDGKALRQAGGRRHRYPGRVAGRGRRGQHRVASGIQRAGELRRRRPRD